MSLSNPIKIQWIFNFPDYEKFGHNIRRKKNLHEMPYTFTDWFIIYHKFKLCVFIYMSFSVAI